MIFNTLQELYDYIPHCIICGKNMNLYFMGDISDFKPQIIKTVEYYTGSSYKINNSIKRVKFGVFLKNGLFQFKHNKNYFSINQATNDIVDGIDLLNNLSINWMHLTKKCKTCRFEVRTMYNSGNTKKFHTFPPHHLVREHLSYTMDENKQVSISNVWQSWGNMITSIYINYKYIKLDNFIMDFSKIKDFKQLNNKLKMILTFQ